MKHIVKILSVFLLVIMLAGCGTLTKSSSNAPGVLQLNISMDDLEYLGESEIEVSYRCYLGFIRIVDHVNGIDYDRTNIKITFLNSQYNSGFLKGVISKAAYKILEDYPEAEYFQPVIKTKVKDRLFLGTNSKIKAVVKAYKYK